jgi:hypothetical protein
LRMMQPLGVALYELSHYAGLCAAISAAVSSPACRWPSVIGSMACRSPP